MASSLIAWPSCTKSVDISLATRFPGRRVVFLPKVNLYLNSSLVRLPGYPVVSPRILGRRKTVSVCRNRCLRRAIQLELTEHLVAIGQPNKEIKWISNVGGRRNLTSLRTGRRLGRVRSKLFRIAGKGRSFDARAPPSEFICLPETESFQSLRRNKWNFIQESSLFLVTERMFRTGEDFSALMTVVGQHLGRYLSLSKSFRRLITKAAGKQRIVVSNIVNDEGTIVGISETTSVTPDKETRSNENNGSEKNLATAAVEATLAANVSTNQLLEDRQTAFRKDSIKTNLNSEPNRQEGPSQREFQSLLQDEELLRKAALAVNADAALAILSLKLNQQAGVLCSEECSQLIQVALAESNVDLAFSILNAMRNSQIQRRVERNAGDSMGDASVVGWRWASPDVRTYIALIRGLAASLRVTDAIQMVGDVERRGIPIGDEVPFGKVVKCPTCDIALVVVQPQHGIQLVPCYKCRYQYELMSGDVVSCESESVSMNISAFERGLRVLQFKKQPLPAAVHSIVVRSPDGLARTHRFGTESVDLPAQEGERVTVASAAPLNASRGVGPFKVSGRAPGWRPSEPMSIANHVTGRVSPLLRAPPKSGSGAALDSSVIIPAAFLLASSDAATALIDPTLPRTVAVSAAAAAVLGTAGNALILPRLNQLPQRTADALALRQELLAQYEFLQARLKDLTQGAAEEVRMLARMCQLQNKMEAVSEPTYSARMERVCKARAGLDERLAARLELIDSYAKVCSMIEIEVEMDADVSAAEAGGATANIAEQIERLMEVEDLQKQWKIQAEVNDEVERLLRSSPVLPDYT